ncbi:MAG: T9SS type A sorting domain-containing protein [Bacteroidetes bacterium]|nr:T9SS type A sorting domain-containing protein [Bacteroidota bacterium]
MRKTTLAILFFFALNVVAQWTPNPSVNTPVSVSLKVQQKVHIASDALNGAVMVWEDSRNSSTNSTDIYADRLNSSGYSKWSLNGLAVCSNGATQKSPVITEAGNGAVIIAWQDNRNGNYDIYAQKIDSSGNALWTNGGIVVCNKTTNQQSPKLIGDNAGGAIIVWEDSLNFYWDISAQRIDANGTAVWLVNGVSVCNAANNQNNPRIDIGGNGGAIITWQDKRNNSDYDIYAQSLDASGVAGWTMNGVVICNSINTQSNPKIEPDGSNGALIAWEDKRNALDYDIYAQRVSSLGVVQWAANGIAVAAAGSNQSAPEMKYVGGNNLCISWKDIRSGSYAIYTQMLNLSGSPLLAANGVQLSSSLKSINPNNIADGNGGVIIAWQDSTSSGWNISSQKLNSLGQIQWGNGGIVVSNAVNDQINVTQVEDGFGGAIFAWEDKRNSTDYDIFAHKIYANGTSISSVKESAGDALVTVSCFPNPVNPTSVIQIKNNKRAVWNLTIYDSFGRLMETATISNSDSYHLSSVYGAGVYFYSVFVSGVQGNINGKFIYASHD